MSAYTSKTTSPRIEYTPPVSGSYCYDPINMAAAAAAAAAATSVNISTPALLYTPSSKAESDMSTSPSTDIMFKRSPTNYMTCSPSLPKRPFFGQNGLFENEDSFEDSLAQRHMKLSADSTMNNTKYQVRDASTSTNTTSNQIPYSYRRPEFVHYSTFADSQSSYYNTLVNSSYQQDNEETVISSRNSNGILYEPLKAECQDNSTSISSSQKQSPIINSLNIDKSHSSILSHHNSSDSQL